MTNSLPKLYGSIISPFYRKALIALWIKNIDHEAIAMNPFSPEQRPALLKLNPAGRIPVYQEGDFILPDSSVICAYLDKKYPQNPLYPTEIKDYATCLWYEEFADSALTTAILSVFFHTCLAPLFKLEPDKNAIAIALEKIPGYFSYLNNAIDDKKYLVTDKLTLADIAISSAFLNFEFAGHGIDSKHYPNLARYRESILREPIIEKSLLLMKEKLLGLMK